MTDKRYQANIITKTKVDPTSNLETGAASGVWSLSEAEQYRKAGVWPTAGNTVVDVNDVFSTFLYTGNSINGPAIETGLNLGQSYGSGGINIDKGKVTTGTNSGFAYGTGDFTYEAWVRPEVDNGTLNTSNMYIFDHGSGNLGGASYYNGVLRYYNGTVYDSTQAINNYEWAHIAVSRSSGYTILFYNGTAVRGISNDTFNYAATSFVIGGYGANNAYGWNGRMAEVRVSNIARYTSNFTPPTTGFTSDSNTILLAGQGSTLVDNGPNSIGLTATSPAVASGYGPFDAATAGDGGMVWFKNRDSTDDLHIYDTERGANKRISSNQTTAQYTGNSNYGLTSFTANGFTVGATGAVNNTGNGICAWSFKKHSKFFDCVTYTGTGSATSISHNLNADVGMLIVKATSGTTAWRIWTNALTGTERLQFDTSAKATTNTSWDGKTPTSTEFYLGADSNTNNSGTEYVAYLFAHNDGDGTFGPDGDADIIKCGSYTGTGALQEIDLGFEAQWVMIKRTDSTQDWMTFDVMRGLVANPVTGSTPTGDADARIRPNSSAAETTDTFGIDPWPTGFRVRGNNVSVSGSTYIYVAIRRGSMSAPTVATDVFEMDDAHATSGNGPAFISGFVTDMVLEKQPDSTGSWYEISRNQGQKYLVPSSTAVEGTGSATKWDYMNGAGDPFSSTPAFQGWMWKRAPRFFESVTYDGNGTERDIPHNLGVTPEMIWVKSRTSTNEWFVYHKGLTSGKVLQLESTAAQTNGDFGSITSTTFGTNTSANLNGSSNTYVAFLFATLDGISKVGSYTGDGSTSRVIDCGFTTGARFVLARSYTHADNWWLFDSVRGIVAGNDARLWLNSTAAEVTNADTIDTHSSGFILTNANGELNDTGRSYIFYAIA